MFRSYKFRTETLSYMPDVIPVMETGKNKGHAGIENFRMRISEKKRFNYREP